MTEIAEKLNNQAIILAEHGAYDDAIACLNRAVTLEQDNYLLWFNLGVTYRDAGKLHEAKLALEKAAEINPEDEDILDSLACYAFERAIILNPYYYDAMFNLRDTYDKLGNISGYKECVGKLKEMKKLGV